MATISSSQVLPGNGNPLALSAPIVARRILLRLDNLPKQFLRPFLVTSFFQQQPVAATCFFACIGRQKRLVFGRGLGAFSLQRESACVPQPGVGGEVRRGDFL